MFIVKFIEKYLRVVRLIAFLAVLELRGGGGRLGSALLRGPT